VRSLGITSVVAEHTSEALDHQARDDRLLRRGRPHGQSGRELCFDALGLACLAHGRGLPVRIESDYLPRAVIEGGRPR